MPGRVGIRGGKKDGYGQREEWLGGIVFYEIGTQKKGTGLSSWDKKEVQTQQKGPKGILEGKVGIWVGVRGYRGIIVCKKGQGKILQKC